MTRKRFAFECWKCSKIYTLSREITKVQKISVACPYCLTEGVVDLALFLKEKKTVSLVRGAESGEEQVLGLEFEFPKIIPTQQPD